MVASLSHPWLSVCGDLRRSLKWRLLLECPPWGCRRLPSCSALEVRWGLLWEETSREEDPRLSEALSPWALPGGQSRQSSRRWA